jgi:hypothetical protein
MNLRTRERRKEMKEVGQRIIKGNSKKASHKNKGRTNIRYTKILGYQPQ